MKSLSIVIPAYNEVAGIEEVVRNALRVGSSVCLELEVLVCNDGSTDGTDVALERARLTDGRVHVLHNSRNRGIEATMRALYVAARGEYVFLNSADRQWPMESLVAMAKMVEAEADLVVGVRHNKRDVYSPYRRIVSRVYDRVARLLVV